MSRGGTSGCIRPEDLSRVPSPSPETSWDGEEGFCPRSEASGVLLAVKFAFSEGELS